MPPIYETFVPQNDKTSQPWKFIHSNESFLNIVPVKPVAQVNGPLPSSNELVPLPKSCRVLRYFKTFMEDIELLENAIEIHSEIKVTTFTSVAERARRDVFQKQLLPLVQHLRLCANCWEKELKKEITSMFTVFEATENSISKHKIRNKVLQNEADRLLEQVLNADILLARM